MRVALIQLDLAWEDVAENHRRASRRLEEAARSGARLALLPEMFPTGFSMDAAKIAQEPGGPSETFLRDEAARLSLAVMGSVAEKQGETFKNVAILATPKGDVVRYAKIHPFSFAGEDRVYTAGDRVVTTSVEELRVTPLVCYDLRFPEPFRLAAKDTDVYAVVANWPAKRREHWKALLRARAIENQAYVLGVNRVGEGNGLPYAGDSAAISPLGETLAEASGSEAVLVVDVDPAVVRESRATFPVLEDIRPASYRR